MDKRKTRENVEKVLIKARVYCGKIPISECSSTKCILDIKGHRCIKHKLMEIFEKLGKLE